MADTTLILHGWSDCSGSFSSLESFLVEHADHRVETVYYADYESREDAITYGDVVGGLDQELRRRGLVDDDGRGSFDVVVHSTGGLVIRQWIWRYYRDRIDACPVENLVMLAPANFGSPLAHRGKSLLGRMFKGRWKIGDLFEVGRKLLNGLELGSVHQWELAHRDLLGPEPLYDADRVRLTVLVGLDDYEGMRGWVGEPGTDGTVVIAGCTLDSVKLTLDFCDPETPVRWKLDTQHGAFAFGTLRGYDHGSIVDAFDGDRPPEEEPVKRHLLSALRVDTPDEFRAHRARVREVREAAYDPAARDDPDRVPTRWQQFLLHAVDDQGRPVRDFTLEFFVHRRGRETRPGETDRGEAHGPRRLTRRERELSREIDDLMTAHFHTYSQDASYRRMLVDGAAVAELLPEDHVLAMGMYVPRVEEGIYYDTDHIRDVVIHDPDEHGADGGAPSDGAGDRSAGTAELPSFLYPNTTTLVELRVDRVTDYVTVGREPREH